jgi:glutamate synthase domain-containing protein 3
MHGGVIYTCGNIFKVGKEMKVVRAGKRDMRIISSLVREFCDYFQRDFVEVMSRPFFKITPISKRPYGNMYS